MTEDGLTYLCKKYISYSFENVPFGDEVCRLLGSIPAKMLHISGIGLILKHTVGCLDRLIEGTNSKKNDNESFDDLHRCIVRDAEQQSERNFP